MRSTKEKPLILNKYGDQINKQVFSSHVVGTTFHENAQEIIKLLKRVRPSNIILILTREPDNEHDENAVAIYVTIKGSSRKHKLGYFPMEGSELIAYVLDNPNEYSIKLGNIRILGGDLSKEFVGLFFDFIIQKH